MRATFYNSLPKPEDSEPEPPTNVEGNQNPPPPTGYKNAGTTLSRGTKIPNVTSRPASDVEAPGISSQPHFPLPAGMLRESDSRSTGRFQFFGRMGISAVFSKRASSSSFAPGYRSMRSNRGLLTHLDYDPGQRTDGKNLQKLDLADISGNRNAFGINDRRRSTALILLGVVVVGLLVAVPLAIVLGASSKESDFCENGDQSMREFIADEFDSAIKPGGTLDYSGKIIECIPDDAFSALSESQKTLLAGVEVLRFSGNALSEISSKALVAPELEGLKQLFIENNGISDLGDDFLASLPSLNVVSLAENAFTKLDSDVFRRSTATTVVMNFNPFLELPNALSDCEQLVSVSITNAPSMVKFKKQMFNNTPLIFLDLTGSGYANIFKDVDTFSAEVGIPAGVLVGF